MQTAADRKVPAVRAAVYKDWAVPAAEPAAVHMDSAEQTAGKHWAVLQAEAAAQEPEQAEVQVRVRAGVREPVQVQVQAGVREPVQVQVQAVLPESD